MIAQSHTATLNGIEALPVTVELDVQGQQTDFVIVGLADKAVQESKERVRAAIKNNDFDMPRRRIICNLAPGDIKKEGPALDLPIALAVLALDEQVPRSQLEETLIIGELGLDGKVRSIDGALSIALMAAEKGFRRLIVPVQNAAEAAVVPSVEVFGVESLTQAAHLLNGSTEINPYQHSAATERPLAQYDVDFSDVKGQTQAIRALEIAAAGGHNVLMFGPPGSGKTMLARRLPTILPPLSLEESIEVTKIYSASGKKEGREGLIWDRPFRSPHHTASYAAIVGGGKTPRPGEISLAHLGVLLMDEMPEFERDVLEALRQPLEDGVISVARVLQSLTFPAKCMLIGAMNPCPCGFKGYPEAKCIGAAACERYAGRISGPLAERIDLHLQVPRLKPEELMDKKPGEPSAQIRERVVRARAIQAKRFGSAKTNSMMSARDVREMVQLDGEGEQLMRSFSQRLAISARVFDRLLKVARTIADLADSTSVEKMHLAEAIQYRSQSA